MCLFFAFSFFFLFFFRIHESLEQKQNKRIEKKKMKKKQIALKVHFQITIHLFGELSILLLWLLVSTGLELSTLFNLRFKVSIFIFCGFECVTLTTFFQPMHATILPIGLRFLNENMYLECRTTHYGFCCCCCCC